MTLKRFIPGAVLLMLIWTMTLTAQETNGVVEEPNLIEIENLEPGTSDWQIPKGNEAYDRQIEGYASKPSVNIGEPIQFYVNVKNPLPFRIDIYRMGYYGGDGGRLVDSITGLQGIQQPLPQANPTTGLMSCNWTVSAEWVAPDDGRRGIAGVYLAKLTSSETYQSYILFVVRDDARQSAFLFQTSVTTYQAYNFWPRDIDIDPSTPENPPTLFQGKSLYAGTPAFPLSWGPPIPAIDPNGVQARKVSFNRPYVYDQNSVYTTAGHFFVLGEYNMVKWMEMKKFDVTYTTDVDTDAATDMVNGPLSPGRHKVFLSVGHDEYWSWQMRDNLEKARNRPANQQPLNIGWFGANNVHWQIRFENDRRTMVAYKHLATNDNINWRDPKYIRPIDGGSEENYLTTNLWRDNDDVQLMGNACPGDVQDCFKTDEDELVGVMTTTPNTVTGRGDFQFVPTNIPYFVKRGIGNTAFPFFNLVGFEADEIFERYTSPASEYPRSFYQIGNSTLYSLDPGSTESTDSHAVYYVLNGNGARVFAAGTVSWGWGVDPFGEPDGPSYNGPNFYGHPLTFDQRVQKMTENILICLRDGGLACKIDE